MINGSPMIPHFWFNQSVHFRKGAISVLKDLRAENVLVIASGSAMRNESFAKLDRMLEGTKNEIEVLQAATEESILEIRSKYKDRVPDAIVSVGGGKVMDGTKVLGLLLENPSRGFSNLLEQPPTQKKPYHIAVATTPATGSEANGNAVIRDAEGIKRPYVSRWLVPDVAILDSSFLTTLTYDQLMTFAGDIFGHAYESMVSKMSNPIVEGMALTTFNLLDQSLPLLKEKPDSAKLITKLQQAGYLGGMAAGSAFVGVCHALGHALELQKEVWHSLAILTLIEPCLKWHAKTTDDPIYESILQRFLALGLNEHSTPELLDGLDAERWKQDALADPSIKTSPVRMKEANLSELVEWVLNR
jgi:alcohol dehydrogenase class IV